MPESIGPAIARDRLRARLRELRESRGLSAADVAGRLTWPESAVDEVESGTRQLAPGDAEVILQQYDVDPAEAGVLLLLARIGRSRWWTDRGLTDEYQDFVQYEIGADRICVYEPLRVPGLLQTPRYAVAVTAPILRLPESDPQVRARAEVRAERQRTVKDRLAAGADVAVVAVLDEIVLRRRVGGDDIMREQLDHLIAETELGYLQFVVMPTELGGHAGLGGIFELLEFRDHPELSVVFLETAISDQLMHGPEATDHYRATLDDMIAAGRGDDEALELVRAIRDEMGT